MSSGQLPPLWFICGEDDLTGLFQPLRRLEIIVCKPWDDVGHLHSTQDVQTARPSLFQSSLTLWSASRGVYFRVGDMRCVWNAQYLPKTPLLEDNDLLLQSLGEYPGLGSITEGWAVSYALNRWSSLPARCCVPCSSLQMESQVIAYAAWLGLLPPSASRWGQKLGTSIYA